MRNVTRLAIITTMVLWLGGCQSTIQIGKENHVHQRTEVSNRKKPTSFRAKYPQGRSLQAAIKDKVNGVNYD